MIHVRDARGVTTLSAEPGESLWQALARAGKVIKAPCGGRRFCGKCKVRLDGPPEPAPEECDHLSPGELAAGFRLACAVFPGNADLTVVLPADEGAMEIMVDASSAQGAIDPAARTRRALVDPPTLEDPRDDLTRLEAAFGQLVEPTPTALAALPEAVRAGAEVAATLFCVGGRTLLLDVGRAGPLYGVAADIGTTTLVAYLMDLSTGAQIDVCSRVNPQAAYGADVVARCEAASSPGGLAALRDAVRGALTEMLEGFASKGVDPRDIAHVVLAGNTVMMHLLAGVSPRAIATLPFAAGFTRGLHLNAAAVLGLPLPAAMASILPGIAGYVGADTVAAVLASGLDEAHDWTLLLDIGTNGEMVLGCRDRLVCCSTAAGPAFEGAHIKHGMGGFAGAIAHVVRADDDIAVATIAGAPAAGLCGSGLLDAVAVLLDLGILDETGLIDPDAACGAMAVRMTEVDGKDAVILSEGPSGPITLTAHDVREVQLAKAAIAAGIRILAGRAGIAIEAIGRVLLAGGFGNYLDIGSACAIGLLPSALRGVTRGIGNAAGGGARSALLRRAQFEKAECIRERMEYIELSALPEFQDLFIENMMFEG